MNGPEAALYSSGPGVKPGGGEPLTVMVTEGAGDEEKREIPCAVIYRDYTCTSDGDNQLVEWPDSFSLPKGRVSCMLLAPLAILAAMRHSTAGARYEIYHKCGSMNMTERNAPDIQML